MRKSLRRDRVGLIVLTAALITTLAAAAPRRDPFQAMEVDRGGSPAPAPDVAFRALDGREVGLRELRGQVVVLGFFTTS